MLYLYKTYLRGEFPLQLGAFSGPIYAFCTWFYRLALINLLWFVFTLFGLILFGLFPATIAMLATLRQLMKKNEVSVINTFWYYYKKEFINSNKLGAVIAVIGFILFINLNFLQMNQTELSQLLYFSSILMSCLYFLIICYLLASYVEFDQRLRAHIKNSVLIAIYNPLASLIIIFGFAAVYFAIAFIPGLGIFFSVSILGLVILSAANIAYRKVNRAKLQTQ